MMIKDLVIVGGGPAGITAAIYAARKRLDFGMLALFLGGQTAWSGEVGNYPGYNLISGPELAIKFKEQLETFKFDLREGAEAKQIEKVAGGFKVIPTKGEEVVARTLIIATGKRPRRLNVPGEAKYNNKGVAFCTTCDGPLFAGKDVAIIGGGNSALDAALQMVRIASKVYLVNLNDELQGDAVMCEKVKAASNLEAINTAKTLEITGGQFVKGLKVEVAGQPRELAVEGVFVSIGLIPNSALIDFVDKNEIGEILVNCAAETSCPGVFAAGDVTSVPEKQIIIAAGDGAKACLSAFRYLSRH